MSNLEAAPAEVECSANRVAGIEVLHPREVPLGGPRAMRVRRTLPQRQRSLIGAWCFIDHYGPASARMDVPPHPHTGLQTVSWLFSGEVEHRDSAGVHALIRPGELNLMTAGGGICHSEVSVESQPGAVLHGVQLWVALPDSSRDTARDFAHYAPGPTSLPGATARVFLGELAGSRSPVHTFSPLLGAQIDLDSNAQLDLGVDPEFEHGVLCDLGAIEIGGMSLAVADLGYQGPGSSSLHLRNAGDGPARVLLLGGTPFAEELVMWWNFVGRATTRLPAIANCGRTPTNASAPSRAIEVRSSDCPPRHCPPPGCGPADFRNETNTADCRGGLSHESDERERFTVKGTQRNKRSPAKSCLPGQTPHEDESLLSGLN